MVSFRSLALALLSAAPFLVLADDKANAFEIPEGFSATAGSSLNLSWTPSTSGTVSLILRTGASSDLDDGSVIASNLENSGSYVWDVPADTVRGTDYTIEIVDDTDSENYNFTPYFVIESTVTVAPTSTSTVSEGAPTSSLSQSTVSPTASSASASSSGSSSSGSTSASTTSSGSSAVTSGSSSLTNATSSFASSVTSASATSASATSNSAGFQASTTGTTTNGAPKANAVAGMLGMIALGALVL